MTMPFTVEQIEAMATIARRVAIDVVATVKPIGVGRVSSVQPDAMRAMVVERGAGLAIEYKVAGGVHPVPGDRVGLAQYGSEWYVVDVLDRVGGPPAGGVSQNAPTGNYASSTPANYPGTPAFSFTKRWDTTPMLVFAGLTWFDTVALNTLGCSLGFTDQDGTQTVYTIWKVEGGGANTRVGYSHSRIIPDPTYTDPLPAGLYTVNLMWWRAAGTGTLNTTNNVDWGSAFAVEMGVWA